MNKLFFLAGLVAMAFTGCGDKDPAKPAPDPGPTEKPLKACFTVDKDFIDSGQYVKFTNCSENQHTNEWRFNNGSPFTEKTPPDRQYNERGTFPVRLIVRNKEATKTDTAVKYITVARHAITRITLKTFKTTNGQGVAWDDDGTGPDIKIVFGPMSNPTQYSTTVAENATAPVSFDITPNIVLDNGNNGGWTFRLYDQDGNNLVPMTTFGTESNPIYPSRGTTSPMEIANFNDYRVELEWILVK